MPSTAFATPRTGHSRVEIRIELLDSLVQNQHHRRILAVRRFAATGRSPDVFVEDEPHRRLLVMRRFASIGRSPDAFVED
jgi:hypothetical protein